MVNQDIVNYIQEGKRRGFKSERLKAELVNHGFEEKIVNEAIEFVENPNKISLVSNNETSNLSINKDKSVEITRTSNMQSQNTVNKNMPTVKSHKLGWIVFFVLLLIIVFLGILLYIKRADIPTWIDIIKSSFGLTK